jgi:hypothetical protein
MGVKINTYVIGGRDRREEATVKTKTWVGV